MSPTSFAPSREANAVLTAQRLMAQFVTPLLGRTTPPISASNTPEIPQALVDEGLPTSQAHQRAVKPSQKIDLNSNTLDVAADPSRVLFAQRAASQVKAWEKVKARTQQKPPIKTDEPSQPEPLNFTDLIDPASLSTSRGRGAGKTTFKRYAETIYRLAVAQYRALGCRVLPHQMSIFTCTELLAKMFQVNLTTIWRWNKRLEAIGFLQAGPHFGSSAEVRAAADERKTKAKSARAAAQVDAGELGAATKTGSDQGAATNKKKRQSNDTVVDGMVYAVRFRPGHRAHLHIEDLQHQYRDLDADRAAGRTAHAIVKQMKAEEAEAGTPVDLKMQGSINPREQEWFSILRTWAVRDFFLDTSLENDPCILADIELHSVEDVIESVTLIREVHVTKRTPLIGFLADAMTRVFHDPSYHRAYCKLLWQAWKEETEGRAGLQVLMAQLSRIHTDRQEWAGLRKPGALLMARMQGAA